ncbi:MAG: TetR/AcrR family transcriptional regulator [Actinomycetes bacterium]
MERHPTEQKILDETIRIIETNGETNVRVHDIEVAVGITAPSIYHFFGNREGLVAEAQAERLLRSFQELDHFLDVAVASVKSRDDTRAALRQLLKMIFDPSRRLARQHRLAALGSAEGRPELALRIAEMCQYFFSDEASRLKPLQENGWVDPDLDLEAFFYWLSGLILGRVYIEIGWEPGPYPEWDEISQRAVEFILLGPD